jgi:hypothetical protein
MDMSEDGDGQGGWQAAVARRLHQEGLDLAEDGQRRAVMLGMMDAAAYPLLANWLGWLARQSGDHDALAANLGQFGAALLNRTEGRHRYPVLASGHLTLDPEAFANLVLLTAALLKYIDWQAGQAEADAAGAFHATADEAITRLVEQTGAGLATQGDLAGYLAALTPGRFIGAPLLELQEQSERQGMGIFG